MSESPEKPLNTIGEQISRSDGTTVGVDTKPYSHSTDTGTPSVSIGVLHEGEIVPTYSAGSQDVDGSNSVDKDTVYLLGSLTKGLIAAARGILVDEEKLSWTEPLSSYVPFQRFSDPIIGERACVRDALSHSTGVPQLDIS